MSRLEGQWCPRHGDMTMELISAWGLWDQRDPRCRVPVDDGTVKVKRTNAEGTVTDDYERRVMEFCGLPLRPRDTESSVTQH